MSVIVCYFFHCLLFLIFYVSLASSCAGPIEIVYFKEMMNKPMIHSEIETFFYHNRKGVMFKTLLLSFLGQCGFEQARYAGMPQVWLSVSFLPPLDIKDCSFPYCITNTRRKVASIHPDCLLMQNVSHLSPCIDHDDVVMCNPNRSLFNVI